MELLGTFIKLYQLFYKAFSKVFVIKPFKIYYPQFQHLFLMKI